MNTRVWEKILLIAVLCVSSQSLVLSNDSFSGYKDIEKRNRSPYEASMMIDTGRKLKVVYKYLNKNLDYLLTKQGAVKTFAIVVPFFIVYCRYFDASPVNDMAKHILQKIGKAEAFYVLQKEIGRNEEIMSTVYNQPWQAFCLSAVQIIKSIGKKIKIPGIC